MQDTRKSHFSGRHTALAGKQMTARDMALA